MAAGENKIEYRAPLLGEDLSGPASWIWMDHHDFYEIFWDSPPKAIAGIKELFNQPRSDLGQSLLAVRENELLGVMCCFPLVELHARSLASLRFLLANAVNPDEAQRKGRQFASQVPSLDGVGLYLARIAVAGTAQGMGVGSGFLHRLEERAMAGGQDRLCLHVRRDNAAARRFYEKHGFSECTETDLAYLDMEKRLDKSSPAAG